MKILDIPQSGKRGLNVSQNGRFGQISRIFSVPSNPRTDAQLNIRDTFAQVTKAWRALTDEQRAAWAAAATTVMSKSRCGTSGPLTGSQLYTKLNATIALVGGDTINVPPVPPAFDRNPVGDLAITNIGGVIKLTLAVPNQPTTDILVRASAPMSAGISSTEGYRILGLLPAPAQGACNITAMYVARFGIPLVTAKVFVQTNQVISGYEDLGRGSNAIVPAAA